MNAVLLTVFGAIFAGLPPLLLAARFVRGRPPWWKIAIAILIVGWASWFGASAFYFEALGDRIDAMENPPPELLERWSDDGGPMVFALLFGWAAAAAYAVPWCLVYFLGLMLRRIIVHAPRKDYLPPAVYRPPGRRL